MKKVCYKYKRFAAAIFLTAYLLLNVVNIVHYHSYDFQNGTASFDVHSTESNHNTFVSFENTFCIIHYFISYSQNIADAEINYSINFKPSKILLPVSSGILINSDYLKLPLLRAPPTLS
ncbi:MAG: hypothetical protein Q8N03_15770 [Ignavibacteria bacterium]|jgi:hypothetical protein|nr:hypothetical protein [Ignavibacteria bacterium]